MYDALNPCFLTTREMPRSSWRVILDGFLNLIYPESCFVCASPTDRGHNCGLCDDCWRKILELRIVGPSCPSCGMPLPGLAPGSTSICLDCLQKVPPYVGARSFGYYSMEMRQLIHELKFNGRRNLAELAAPLLARTLLDSWRREDFDFITAVPLHPARRRDRGFNQSELLARSLASVVGIPEVNTLRRVTNTRPQIGLSDTQRQENVRNAFRCAHPEKVTGKRILLIDDVMTTGATVMWASQALLDAGAEKVAVMTAARALR